jgi:hypothetical protein
VWDDCVGEEGVLDPHHSPKVLSGIIIADAMPWWSLYAHKLGVSVRLVILRKPHLVSLAKTIAPEATFVISTDDIATILAQQELVDECDILFTDERCPTFDSSFWKMPRAKLIVSNGSRPGPPPPKWDLTKTNISHQGTGGCTNQTGTVWIWSKVPNDAFDFKNQLLKVYNKPPQDLRMVLKLAKSGKPVPAPSEIPPENQATVMWVSRNNTVASHGLFPLGTHGWDTRVHTRFGGNAFVERELTRSERLDVLNVPETIATLAQCEENEDQLLASVQLPLKIYQEVADRLVRTKPFWAPSPPSKRPQVPPLAQPPLKRSRLSSFSGDPGGGGQGKIW